MGSTQFTADEKLSFELYRRPFLWESRFLAAVGHLRGVLRPGVSPMVRSGVQFLVCCLYFGTGLPRGHPAHYHPTLGEDGPRRTGS